MIRRLRANLLDELQKQYVTTGRAKGLPPGRLLLKYPLRMSLNPFIADIGSLLPEVISGAVVVSVVMSLPTTGRCCWMRCAARTCISPAPSSCSWRCYRHRRLHLRSAPGGARSAHPPQRRRHQMSSAVPPGTPIFAEAATGRPVGGQGGSQGAAERAVKWAIRQTRSGHRARRASPSLISSRRRRSIRCPSSR
jgi:ABC-type dipeptide/oligopeptide/nickel transport systems, permease components